ncbi:MAG TPA: chloramphenicol phosphotransferase CPT family protein [Rickettsia endosymbiont of Sericostoma sp.]|uniref:chloramphenicol phosphotransferase CPT family protein n=1 Tax=Candidatus Tisiphia endosymbiont of Nemotelus uliginosus TaxID=3077926 RepID=UPI001DC12F05|nr:chloramphenicol phosphotransferase CPT family protein [Rickettsia endosymbiont of Sericostoma sp.]
MSKIIFLNGCGSAGKTSIARSIQHLSKDSWLTFGVDSFINMMPCSYNDKVSTEYFTFVSGTNDRGATMRVESGEKGEQLFGVMPDFANLLASRGNNIIIDEVLLDDSGLKSYIKTLSSYIVYFVGVFCDLSVMQEREILRCDRAIGLSNDQIDRVHASSLREYDLTVDTTSKTAFANAKQILEFVDNNPAPQGFITMRKMVYSTTIEN